MTKERAKGAVVDGIPGRGGRGRNVRGGMWGSGRWGAECTLLSTSRAGLGTEGGAGVTSSPGAEYSRRPSTCFLHLHHTNITAASAASKLLHKYVDLPYISPLRPSSP